jgi:hypothetical protein
LIAHRGWVTLSRRARSFLWLLALSNLLGF